MNKAENYLTSALPPDNNHPNLNAYRSLGMMAILDIDYWQGHSDRTISDYYSSALPHFQKNTVLLSFSDDKKPVGYAIWDNCDQGRVCVTRLAAPFGDHLKLLKELRALLPEGTKVNSLHERSACREQIAW
ncbi:MAG: hypothetical protein ABJN14_07530 [Paracoccaceae bacterium]